MIARSLAVAVLLLGFGCAKSRVMDEPCAAISPPDEADRIDVRVGEPVDDVDLLFVVDNSGSLSEEQTSLNMEIPRIMQTLATGEHADGSTFPPVRDLRVGVVTTDMGVGGFAVFTCNEPNFGDDGILRTRGNTMIEGCMATYPPFLGFMPEFDRDTAGFAADVTCVAAVGTNGCGFEQQLDAALKAVSLSTATDHDGYPLRFASGTTGHGDGANAGFLRPDALLAIVMVTDEDDCSAIDPDVFNEGSTRYPGRDLNLRCFQYPEATHPIQRYVEGFIQTRTRPDLVLFGVIAGVPPDLIGTPTDYDALLDDERMLERPDPETPSQLNPSCNVPGRGKAFPPRRIVSVARDLERAGARAVVQSICQESFAGPIDAILREIGDALTGACLARSIPRMASGLLDCELFEALPPEGEVTRCEQLPGRTLDQVVDADRGLDYERCRVDQLPGPIGSGWFYDDASADVLTRCEASPQRIALTPGAETVVGSRLFLQCSPPPGEVRAGTVCTDPTICSSAPGLACDPLSHRCHALCTRDSECTGALGAGRVCGDPDGDGQSFCVDAACLSER